jgi:hypothetical protein
VQNDKINNKKIKINKQDNHFWRVMGARLPVAVISNANRDVCSGIDASYVEQIIFCVPTFYESLQCIAC